MTMKDKPPTPLPEGWELAHRRPHGKFDLKIPGFADGAITLYFPRPPLERVAPETESMAARAARLETFTFVEKASRRYMRAARSKDYSKPAPDELELEHIVRCIVRLNYYTTVDHLNQLLSGDKWKGLTRSYLAVLIRRKR
jgi:hypothetical protein